MSYRALATFPAVFVATSIALLLAVPASGHAVLLRVLIELAKVLALVGLGSAALAFAPGDYLRRGWGLVAGCYALLIGRDLWINVATGAPPVVLEIGRAAFITLANASAVLGTWTLARAWNVAGLELPGPRVARRVIILLAVAASVVFAGPSVVLDLKASIGHPEHLWAVASDLGDVLALPVLAPVSLTALAVRGGTLRWAWGLMTVSLGAWLLYDAALTLPDLIGTDGTTAKMIAEQFRFIAATSAFSAGLAQRKAVHELDGVNE